MNKRVFRLFTLALLALIGGFVQAQTLSVLYNFGSAYDPSCFLSPGALAQGPDGNVYTTSVCGGNPGVGNPADGTVFAMTTAGVLSEPYTFTWNSEGLFASGDHPYGGLTLGADGDFYGTTYAGGVIGGANAFGTVFRLDSGGTLTTLYTFTGGSDGAEPLAAPVQGRDGNFYGTTICGGIQTCPQGSGQVGGTVYRLTPAGVLTVLHQFDCSIGCAPFAPLVQGKDGNFYGTTLSSPGTIFKISPSGKFKTLYQFDGAHGQSPRAPLFQGRDGRLYGTTEIGGVHGHGVVFKMTLAGQLTVLHSFADDGTDGYDPVAGLVQATDGKLYGVTADGGIALYGTIFSISPKGGYSNPPLYNFDGVTGIAPQVALLQHTNGRFYGLTDGGGSSGPGTFYSFDVGIKPFVRLVRTSGAVGTAVGILGQGFTGTKKVSFTGGNAVFTVVSDTYLTAMVPSGAKTGIVSVETSVGTLKSNWKFHVTQ